MADNFSQMNPLHGVYLEFQKILKTMVIKYSYLAEQYETFEIKREADMYIACKNRTDTFFSYTDYSIEELYAVGITDASAIASYTSNNGYLNIPKSYRDILLENRRKNIIQNYEEKNDYYRQLNGMPSIKTPPNKYHYISKSESIKYGVDPSIPIHKIQDYYNNISPGKGDYIISNIEGLGILDTLIKKYPEDEYLKYIGSARIDIEAARKAKNFQLLHISRMSISTIIYDEFVKIYEQVRDYHISTIFVREYRNIIPYYDRFIALCIMCMSIEVTLNRQFKLGIDRKFYNDYTLKLLYDAYGVPYNMDIDEYTQQSISQSLNSLIQKKSTDEVFYDITKILGFKDLKIYRYYLTKERKFDIYGVPVVSYTEKFNNDTGEIEKIPNYSEMYDIYFQKVELPDNDFVNAYNSTANTEKYEQITQNDPFWWNDENTFKSVFETEYNFVEAKYLSVGLSYKMTEIMYENIILLKMLISMKDELSSLTFTLPKIDASLNVNLFDAIILLFCLMAKKHNLRGEIISIPTQVTSVLDYLHNTDGGDEFLVDSFSFNFDLLRPDNEDGQKLISDMSKILDKDDANKIMTYITSLSIDPNLNDQYKVILINDIFNNIKNLSNYLQFLMAKAPDRKTYEVLKTFYNASFYSKEVKSIFTINENSEELSRTAKDYFEFLYHHNSKLYSALFVPDFEGQYYSYITENDINPDEYTLEQFKHDVEFGNIDDFTYSTLKPFVDEDTSTSDLLYHYIDHIISRIGNYINNLKYIYMANDTTTPLEELFIKLINFFKSFTVDMLGLDVMYIINLRAENTMKIFDEVASITKDLYINDNMNLSYNDVLHLIDVVISDNNDKLSFYDKVLYDVYITLAKDSKGNKLNHLNMTDKIISINSNVKLTSESNDNLLKFTDIIRSSTTLHVDDKSMNGNMFRDEIVAKYYSD